ncbi:hypothetical protein [Methanolobus sp.]|uniref:hypothetical protein n=1 Tax=Methanolobus sp. TaxID=1874737 RepID=UPI002600362E|nr:hypothetical protein [Methanolobus sp.]
MYTKCAGIAGRTRAGTSYYCSHPDIDNPVPVIPSDCSILNDCPAIKQRDDVSTEHRTAG